MAAVAIDVGHVMVEDTKIVGFAVVALGQMGKDVRHVMVMAVKGKCCLVWSNIYHVLNSINNSTLSNINL